MKYRAIFMCHPVLLSMGIKKSTLFFWNTLYVNKDNEIKTVMKAKSITKKELKEEFYINGAGKVKFITI